MSELPSGTVTFVFTDLVVSTRLWDTDPDGMRTAMARHDALLRGAIEGHDGLVVKGRGDGVHAVFATADAAVLAAVDAQRSMASEIWDLSEPLRIRIGIHTGVAELRDGDYFGSSVNRAARLEAIAHGGQIVCSQATADLVRDGLVRDVELVDLGDHRLRDLSRVERVYQVVTPDLAATFPPLRSLDAFPGNLPLQVTSFVGRELEMARVSEALASSRVVTLTGVGGVGKTRLAQQVAADVLDRYRDGAWLVELAPVRDPDDVVQVVAVAFDVAERAGATLEDAIVEFFGPKQLLLVLDNCEHVLDVVGDLVEHIERTCPRVSILTTSREPLAVDGEHVLGVRSLATPRGDERLDELEKHDAVRLFVQRARAHDGEFALNEANAPEVASICRRLDGIPLAIELAAARTTTMSPTELAYALERRLDVLAGARRRAVKRQQTLRATIDWSYDLLDEGERRLLARMSVFAGGCSRAAVETVCGAAPLDPAMVFGLLSSLVARSLVEAVRDGPETRFRLLETIREYGEERLAEHGEVASLRDRHRVHYGAFIDEWGANVAGPDQILWAKRLSAERDNVLAAWSSALDTQDVDTAVRIALCSRRQAGQIGNVVHVAFEPLLALEGTARHPDFALVLANAAGGASERGDTVLAEEYAERARAADHRADPRVEAQLLSMEAVAASNRGDPLAGQATERAAAAWDRAGHIANAALFRAYAANAYASVKAFDHAALLAEEAVNLARAVGMPSVIVIALFALGTAVSRTDEARARACLDEGLEIGRTLEIDNFIHLFTAAVLASALRDRRLALELAAQAIRGYQRTGPGAPVVLLDLVARALDRPRPEAAARIHDAVNAWRAGEVVDLAAVAEYALAEATAELAQDS